ncbi:spore germination protein [Hydrogenibacillus schlegelii]|uniref:spore germination protein n=1 Tax=Hydrogenibacillus schlegelii TaxID=1484 RepID=UPI003C6D5C92
MAVAAPNDSLHVPVRRSIEENVAIVKDRAGVGTSFDVGVREILVGKTRVAIFYSNGLVDAGMFVHVLRSLAEIRPDDGEDVFRLILARYATHVQVETRRTIDEAIDLLLSGLFVLFVDGHAEAIVLDGRMYPNRSPEEPDTERVVRGARDGFTESIITNAGLIRRRLRDERLRLELTHIGERSKTDVVLAYIRDIADPGLVQLIRERLQAIEIDGLPMTDKSLQELLIGQTWNPYPLVRYTERPDVAVQHLLEGHVLLIVDTSPSVMILPTTFFHHVQHAEEYRQTPVTGAYLRWVRLLGILASIFLLPLWVLYTLHPELLPDWLRFLGPKKPGKVPLLLQVLAAEFGLDLMRMAAVHTPSPLATAMGVIAAVLVGDVAVKVGLLTPEVLLYLAFAAIGLFATPSYELSLANRLARLWLILAVFFFGIPGFVLAATLLVIALVFTRSLDTPYFWPLIPFNGPALWHVLVRTAVPQTIRRPSVVHPQNTIKN